jgi:ABC-2 type transport system permease protein
VSFCSKRLAVSRLNILASMEYPLNFVAEAIFMPLCSGAILLLMWQGIFDSLPTNEFAGYTRENYLLYALWASFCARYCSTWNVDFEMIAAVNDGTLNRYLLRPLGFFQTKLFEVLGYQCIRTIAFIVPLFATACFFSTVTVPLGYYFIALALLIFYIIFALSLSHLMAGIALFFNRADGLIAVKNIAITIVAGEFFPLDMLPNAFRSIVMYSPFASSVYIPAGLLSGRVGLADVGLAIIGLVVGLLCSLIANLLVWRFGLKRYTGVGA